jgi:hypothetical protein
VLPPAAGQSIDVRKIPAAYPSIAFGLYQKTPKNIKKHQYIITYKIFFVHFPCKIESIYYHETIKRDKRGI